MDAAHYTISGWDAGAVIRNSDSSAPCTVLWNKQTGNLEKMGMHALVSIVSFQLYRLKMEMIMPVLDSYVFCQLLSVYVIH